MLNLLSTVIAFVTLPMVIDHARHHRSPGNISLANVCATSGQPELKQVSSDPAVRTLFDSALPGPSTAFFVDADSFGSAAFRSIEMFRGEIPADKVTSQETLLDERRPSKHWLVVHLGNNARHPGWNVRSVHMDEYRVRFCYSRKSSKDSTRRHFVYWAPLGQVKADSVLLELVDEDDTVTFSRWVTVGSNKARRKTASPIQNPRTIAKDDVHATNDPGLNNAFRVHFSPEKQVAGNAVDFLQYRSIGTSNLFVVSAPSLANAVIESSQQEIIQSDVRGCGDSDDHWLFVNLEKLAGGRRRFVATLVDDSTIRFSYREELGIASPRQLYWVRLGKLPPGEYRLEVHDADRDRIDFTRRVSIAADK